MNIVLTGASGFIGQNFKVYCENLGHAILVIGRKNGDKALKTLDLRDTDYRQLIDNFKPDIVVNLATHFDLSPMSISDDALLQGTFGFHIALSNALKAYDIPWVYTSSYWQYLRNSNGSYISDYHFLKASVEEYLSASHNGNFQSVVLMDTYGEKDVRKKIVKTLMDFNDFDIPMLLSGGEQFLSLLHVQDVCSGLYKVCLNMVSGLKDDHPQYLISADFITLKELVKHVESIRAVELPIEWGAKPYRPGEILTKPIIANRVPSWTPAIDLKEGLSRFL